MIKKFNSEKYGEISYAESSWTGSKKVLVNGDEIKKMSKNLFCYEHEGETVKVIIVGNIFNGTNMVFGDENYSISPKPTWCEYTLAILNIILIIVWGNNALLCSIVPVIGGAVSGVMSICAMALMKNSSKPLLKVLIGVGFIVLTFAVCAIAGIALVSVLAQLV